MRIVIRIFLPIVGAFFLSACDSHVADMPCDPVGALEPICGLQAPEDIEATPDGRFLLLSQFGGLDGGPGSIALFDPATEKAELLFPLRQAVSDSASDWGDANCPGNPGTALSPHGIHLARRESGEWQLLVVNHGGRESVEFFHLAETPDGYRLRWRGCAVMPEGSYLNDVAALPEGGFLVTHMLPKGNWWAMITTFTLGSERGHVWHWRPGSGASVAPWSHAPFPNGIQISADGERVFLNLYTPGRVRVVDRRSGEILAELPVDQPDNSAWLADGRLVVASHVKESLLPGLCTNVYEGACPQRFQLVAIDPDDLTREVLLDHGGAPMGAGTVAQQLGDGLYVGSYAGNRLLRVPMSALGQ